MTAKEFLYEKIHAEILFYNYSIDSDIKETVGKIINRWSDDSLFSEKQRFENLEQHFPNLKEKRILDMAAGCGSFVLQGLIKGYNTYGVEPEDWKQELIDIKFLENKYSNGWRNRLLKGYGEKLPYEDSFFDVFDSWQTFEHVQNVQFCLNELYRVTKKKGGGIIHCPSYATFFEAHYRIFWFPMMGDSAFSRAYLKFKNRPTEGLKTFVPINKKKLITAAKIAGFEVINIKKQNIYTVAKRKIPFLQKGIFKWLLPIIYLAWSTKIGITKFGVQERNIHLKLTKN